MKSPQVVLIAVLALTTVGGATLAWKQYQELILLRAASLDPSVSADLQRRLEETEKHARDLANQLAALSNHPIGENPEDEVVVDTAKDAKTPVDRRGRGRQGGPGGGGPNGLAVLMQKPEVQKLLALQQRSQLDTRYAALFKSLNLNPEQLEKFKTLLVERQASMMDVMSAAREQGVDPRKDQQAYRALIESTRAEIENSIKSTIGDSAYSQYKSFEQTGPQRETVDHLQQSLSYTATPLTSDQAARMVQILAQTTPQPTKANGQAQGQGRGGVMGGGGGVFAGQTPSITNETINLAQGVLTPPQLSALQQLQQAQLAQQQVSQLLRQNAGGNNNNARATTPGGTTAQPNRKAKGG